jgi:hypothetical protein
MSKIKVMPASKEMLAKQLREALNDITVEDERKEIVGQLAAQLMLLERQQEMRYVVRAAFWKCNYSIFNYLRIQEQTGRETGAFDRAVRKDLKELLDGLVRPEADSQDDAN